jgi:tetratricopeptide (TPR) repeat protein
MDNSTPEMSEKLVQYLDGELSGVEKENLEQKLAADKVLQAELESLQSTREAVKLYGLRQRVAFVHGQMMDEMQPSVKTISPIRKNLRYSVAIAASLLLLIAGYMAYNFFTLSPDKVFASNYKSYELSIMRGNGTQELSLLEEPYIAKEYAKVVGIKFDRSFTIKELFLRAMSYAELADNTKAIDEYKKIIAQNEIAKTNSFSQQTEYYLALSYIRNKDYGFALDILNKINDDPNHLYHEKVTRKLIRQVKRLKWR